MGNPNYHGVGDQHIKTADAVQPKVSEKDAGACSTFGILHATKLLPKVGRDQGRLILYLQLKFVSLAPIGCVWCHLVISSLCNQDPWLLS